MPDQTTSERVASNWTPKIQFRLEPVAPDIQVQSEHCLGLNFLRPIIQARTKQPQPRPDSIKQDIQAQAGERASHRGPDILSYQIGPAQTVRHI